MKGREGGEGRKSDKCTQRGDEWLRVKGGRERGREGGREDSNRQGFEVEAKQCPRFPDEISTFAISQDAHGIGNASRRQTDIYRMCTHLEESVPYLRGLGGGLVLLLLRRQLVDPIGC